ncbi:helix-turn-helix domain-containing protein [Brucella tritici]|uniref:Helix-turn-helix domain-containing protein n=1 Tax=Brucella tritici TaxID=94626 RepID=A0A7V8B1Q5_9HYPH|nr:S24 family peptidase [Brucella tritici]KAB2656294.1 helix-turn-helix domain-containing protein [Brucella tritici]
MDISRKVKAILTLKHWTQTKFGDAVGVSQSTVNRWLKGTEPEGAHRDRINEIFLSEFPDEGETRTVPLIGRIGAGQAVYPLEDGGYDEVEAPLDAHPDTVAAEVIGDSMFPVFQDRWLIFWSRQLPPAELINKLCVVHLEDGRRLVKTLRVGSEPGLWTLSSFNASDIVDVPVTWAAPIDWIKPRD